MSEIKEKSGSMEIQEDDLVFDRSMKKKKKSKRTEEMDVEEIAEAQKAAPATELDAAKEDPMAMFGEKKKKKKSKKVDFSAFEEDQEREGEEGGVRDPDNVLAADDVGGSHSAANSDSYAQEGWIGTNHDYTYTELLSRVFKILRHSNPELAGEKKRYTIVPPSVMRDGNKKTIFANVADICRKMHRPPEHVIHFLFAELGTSGSIDGSQRLVIKGRFQQKQIEVVLRRYIVEYLTCKTCKSPHTLLNKENRLLFLYCEDCGSTRSVSAIRSGFQAQTGKRAAQRVKAA